jgi:hypothetical protein
VLDGFNAKVSVFGGCEEFEFGHLT